MRTNWFFVLLFVTLVINMGTAINLQYKKGDSNVQLNVYCNSSYDTKSFEHNKLLDEDDYSDAVLGIENVAEICFEFCAMLEIPSDFLKKLSLVQKISLTHSGVRSIKGDDFVGNAYLKILLMNGNYLAGLPENLFTRTPQIEEVNFSYNKIIEIKPKAFVDGKRLRKINLSFNNIKTLDADLFEESNMLQYIDLSHNSLAEFKPNLSDLTELRHLSLEGNRLTQLGCTIFPTSGNTFKVIDAPNNQLKSIDLNCDTKYAPSGHIYVHLNVNDNKLELLRVPNSTLTKSLKKLLVKRNKIREISIESDLPVLQKLHLASNRLEKVSDVFEHCGSLMELDLSSNNIRELLTIGKLTNLTVLRLNNNSLTKIDDETFWQLQNLSTLDLSYNQLFELFLPHFDQLTYLNLNDNSLTEIAGWWNFSKLNHLGLSNNHFNCSYLESSLRPVNIPQVRLIPSTMTGEAEYIHGVDCAPDSKYIIKKRALSVNDTTLNIAQNDSSGAFIYFVSTCLVLLLFAGFIILTTLKIRGIRHNLNSSYQSFEYL